MFYYDNIQKFQWLSTTALD